MQTPSARARVFHRVSEHRVGEEFSVLNHQLNARAVHVHDAAGADVEVADFAVAHLAVRQADRICRWSGSACWDIP